MPSKESPCSQSFSPKSSTVALSLFIISSKLVEAFERTQHNFLWLRLEDKKHMSLIAWESFCRPQILAGLDVRSI